MPTASLSFLTADPGLDRPGQRRLVEEWLAGTGHVVRRTCPHCGSAGHGRPRLGTAALSLAYAAGLVAVAVADVAVGVDLEKDGLAPAPFPDRLAWTRAEAVLKLTGEGLRREPASVALDEAWTATLAAPPGYVASLAAYVPVEISSRTGTPEALAPPATGAARP